MFAPRNSNLSRCRPSLGFIPRREQSRAWDPFLAGLSKSKRSRIARSGCRILPSQVQPEPGWRQGSGSVLAAIVLDSRKWVMLPFPPLGVFLWRRDRYPAFPYSPASCFASSWCKSYRRLIYQIPLFIAVQHPLSVMQGY